MSFPLTCGHLHETEEMIEEVAVAQNREELEEKLWSISPIYPWLRACISYVIARLLLDEGRREEACKFAKRSKLLFRHSPDCSYADCYNRFVSLLGVYLPDFPCEQTVDTRLGRWRGLPLEMTPEEEQKFLFELGIS